MHRAGITNLDANGFSRNPSLSDEDLTGAWWHGDCNREAVLGWHAVPGTAKVQTCITLSILI